MRTSRNRRRRDGGLVRQEGRACIETQRDTLMSKSMSPVDIRPEQVAAEVAALGEKIARGTKLFQDVRDEDVAIATTPKDEIWRQDKVTLHHYRPLTEAKVRTPVLIVYGLIGRYTMADSRRTARSSATCSIRASTSTWWIGAIPPAPTAG